MIEKTEMEKMMWIMDNHIVMDEKVYDKLNRKLSIYDIDVSSRDIILRLDLDVSLSPFVTPPKGELLSHKSLEQAAGPSAGPSVGSKQGIKKSELDSVASGSPLGEEEGFWRHRQILDHTWVKGTVAELKMIMERMANRIFVIGNLGDRAGRIMGENSMRLIQHELQQHIQDIPIHFLSSANRTDIQQKKEDDELFDNCIYIVENLNFHPEEFGQIIEAPPTEVEDKPAKEENSQEVTGSKNQKSGKNISKNVTDSQPLSQKEQEKEEDHEM